MLWHRTDGLRALGAADPGAEGEGLGVHILEPCFFQPSLCPCDCPLMGLGAGKTRPDLRGERLHEREGRRVIERPLSEARSDAGQRRLRRLLRTCRERPCQGRAAERGYELPPSDADCHFVCPQRRHARCNVRTIITPQIVVDYLVTYDWQLQWHVDPTSRRPRSNT